MTKQGFSSYKILTMVSAISAIAFAGFAQQPITLQEAKQLALKNNPSIKTADLEIEKSIQVKKTSSEVPKTSIMLMHGQYNSFRTDNSITISQTIPFPTTWTSLSALGKAVITSNQNHKRVIENEILFQVSTVYVQLLYLIAKRDLLLQQDSLYEGLVKASSVRYRTGESTLLEKIAAETQLNEVRNMLLQNEADRTIYLNQLQVLIGAGTITEVSETFQNLQLGTEGTLDQNPGLQYYKQQNEVVEKQKSVEAARMLPDITVGYFNQSLIGYQSINGQEQYFSSSDRFDGFQIGLTFPLWFRPGAARIKSYTVQSQIAQQEYDNYQKILNSEYQQALEMYGKTTNSLVYYETYALPNAKKLIQQSQISFREGETDYSAYLINLKNALTIHEGHVNTLRDHFLNILKINYLTGKLSLNED